MYKISIIIPVYNAEKTIRRAIDSIICQKWNGNLIEDIEIILIDDCSSDNSKNIMEEYSKEYSNIKVYSTEYNTGFPAKPRNIGIEKSNGTYIMFMDNDDKYCEDICQTLFEVITQKNVDVVVCNIFHKFLNQDITKVKSELNVKNFLNQDDKIILDSYNAILFNDINPWNKIFDKSKLNQENIRFPTSYPEILLDDRFFFLEFYSKIDELVYLKDYYGLVKYTSDQSLSLSRDEKLLIECIDSALTLQKLADSYVDFNKNPKFRYKFINEVIDNFVFKLTLLTNINDLYFCLKKMHNFEKEISFDNSITGLNKFINFFILKNYLYSAIFLIKIVQIFRKSNNLRKIINKLYKLIK